MSVNPYTEATIGPVVQQPTEPMVPSKKIQWWKIALCYVVGFVSSIFLSFVVGIVIGVMAMATATSLQDVLNSPAYYVVSVAVTVFPLVICVVWLVKTVRSRAFLHASIFAAINFVVDVLFAVSFPLDQLWFVWTLAFIQLVVILVTAKIFTPTSKDSGEGMRLSTES